MIGEGLQSTKTEAKATTWKGSQMWEGQGKAEGGEAQGEKKN